MFNAPKQKALIELGKSAFKTEMEICQKCSPITHGDSRCKENNF